MVRAYAIIPILSGLLLAYIFSLMAQWTGVIQKKTHRKFWNVLLLVAFLVTANLGLVLALQVNYKFKLALLDPLMKVHVDFGIALAIISIFHLTWHIPYYLQLFRQDPGTHRPENNRKQDHQAQEDTHFLSGRRIMIPVLVLGFTTMITQVVMIREFLHVFQGNELVIGIILANWLFLTATGALLGKFSVSIQNRYRFASTAFMLMGILPLFMVFLLYTLKNEVFLAGSLTGIFDVFLSSLVLLAPFCILSGYAFTFLAHVISEQTGMNKISQVYGYESVGALAGGVLFSIVLIHILDVFQILAIVFLINTWAICSLRRCKPLKLKNLVFLIPALLLLLFTIIFDVDRFTQHFLYRNQEILETEDTPYGHLVVTQSADQINIYENQMLLASSMNVIANEEDVHYTMLQHPDPKTILLVSGSITGMIDEILKYPVDRIDVVEINPEITRLGAKYAHSNRSEKVHLLHQDARKYVVRPDRQYDVVLMHMPAPSTAQVNRYYTREFFERIVNVLEVNGVYGFGLPYAPNYPGQLTNNLLSQVYSTLHPLFEDVVCIAGEKLYFICGPSGQLGLNVLERLEMHGISNEYVTPYYLDQDLVEERSAMIQSGLRFDLEPNTDFFPRTFFWEIRIWLSYFNWDTRILFGIIGLVLLFVLTRMRTLTMGMFTAGFAGTGIEFIIIFMFQVLYGYVYLLTGIIITVFMAGIALGALIPRGICTGIHPHKMAALLGLVALTSALTPVLFYILANASSIPDWAGQILLLTWSLFFSYLIGRVFYQASYLHSGPEAGISARIYSMDLFGATFGALLVASFLLPLMGIWQTCMIIGLLNVISSIFLRAKLPGPVAFSN